MNSGRHADVRLKYLEEIGAPLAIDRSGNVTAAEFDQLRRREAAAVQCRDYVSFSYDLRFALKIRIRS